MHDSVIVVFEHDGMTDAESLANGLETLLKTALDTVFSGVFDEYGNAKIVAVTIPQPAAMPLRDVRLERTRVGRLDQDGRWVKPTYAVKFLRGETACSTPVISTSPPDHNRPTGQDVLDAMFNYLNRGEVTEGVLLEIPVKD